MADLSTLTTLQVGGPADTVVTVVDPAALVGEIEEVWAEAEDWLVLGGGSNLLISDEGFPGTVIRIATLGIDRSEDAAPGTAHLLVQAGEPWDELVAWTVSQGLVGIESLSGIPGASGAAPIQNIGAYGQEVGSSLTAVHFLDYQTGMLSRMPVAELELGYRTSVFKRGLRGVVTAIELQLADPAGIGQRALSSPIAYAQLASALGVGIGDRVPLDLVREAVLGLRGSKGMLIDPADPDSRSAGSFFTNPIVSTTFAADLPTDAPRFSVDGIDEDRAVKLSAAWLIEQSGIPRGFSLPGSDAAVSSKHTLALVNRGHATAEQIAELARYIRARVLAEFGLHLQAEPVLVGVSL
jgi:UDP-N-acetylmuramate dehydrogenase